MTETEYARLDANRVVQIIVVADSAEGAAWAAGGQASDYQLAGDALPGDTLAADGAVTQSAARAAAAAAPRLVEVSKLHLQRALRAAGVWELVKAALGADEEASEDWQAASRIRSDDPLVAAMAAAVGISAAELAAVFDAAAAAERGA